MTTETSFINYYELLNIPFTANEKQIKRAYRLKALTCHPDKVGPDDVEAGRCIANSLVKLH